MKGAKGLYFGANNAVLVPVNFSSTDVAVAVKTLGAKGPYCQKLPNLTTRAVRSNEYELVTGGHNYRGNSNFIAELSVLCNLEDLDFNRVIFILFRINKSVTSPNNTQLGQSMKGMFVQT